MHWVEATHAIPAEFRNYQPLILDENGEDEENEGKSFLELVNPNSLEILQGFVEPNMKDVQSQDKFQFFRHGYYNVDPKNESDKLIFNLIVSLKSSFKL